MFDSTEVVVERRRLRARFSEMTKHDRKGSTVRSNRVDVAPLLFAQDSDLIQDVGCCHVAPPEEALRELERCLVQSVRVSSFVADTVNPRTAAEHFDA